MTDKWRTIDQIARSLYSSQLRPPKISDGSAHAVWRKSRPRWGEIINSHIEALLMYINTFPSERCFKKVIDHRIFGTRLVVKQVVTRYPRTIATLLYQQC